jgi:hypothetical protein
MQEPPKEWYTFIDMATGKTRRTGGTFAGWTPPTGPHNTPYAIFRNKRSDNLIPHYLLTTQTRRRIGSPPQPEN